MKTTGNKTQATVKPLRLRVAIADDHVLTRESLFSMISQNGRRCELLAQASNTGEILPMCRQFTLDLLLVDVDMPGQSVIALVPEIKRIAPATRILFYCTEAREADVLKAMRAGVDGFLEKTCSRSDFLQAVDRLTNGDNYMCPNTINMVAKSLRGSATQKERGGDGHPELTRREKEILALVAGGDSSKEIAKKLFLSVSTVETHRANVMTKIGARNVAQLIHYGFQTGLVKFGQAATS